VQEPVAWLLLKGAHKESFWLDKGDAYDFEFTSEHEWKPLYTTPPAAQREFVGLTDEEAQWLYDNCRTPANLIDMVEAKLRSKNEH
jgi:hypothetical protein